MKTYGEVLNKPQQIETNKDRVTSLTKINIGGEIGKNVEANTRSHNVVNENRYMVYYMYE